MNANTGRWTRVCNPAPELLLFLNRSCRISNIPNPILTFPFPIFTFSYPPSHMFTQLYFPFNPPITLHFLGIQKKARVNQVVKVRPLALHARVSLHLMKKKKWRRQEELFLPTPMGNKCEVYVCMFYLPQHFGRTVTSMVMLVSLFSSSATALYTQTYYLELSLGRHTLYITVFRTITDGNCIC